MTPSTMRAVVIHQQGPPDVLTVEPAWPTPQPESGEVLLRVRACGLNHLDVFVRRGMPGLPVELPRITGGDLAGEVAALGPEVEGVPIGQRALVDPSVEVGPSGRRRMGALGEHTQGGLCEYAAVPAANLIPLPDDVTFEQAACLPIAYGAAWHMLVDRGRIQPGEHVLVLGASGGVGNACVQIAALAGAVVYAGASSDAKLERLRALGAAHLINTSEEEFSAAVWRLSSKRGVDVVVDYSGQDTWPGSIKALARHGRVLTCGATSGYDALTDLRYVWTRELSIVGANGWTRSGLEALLELVRQRKLTPVIDRVVPLEGVRDAEEAMEQRRIFGKVIVRP